MDSQKRQLQSSKTWRSRFKTLRDRSFAWMGVIIIVISTAALSVFFIIQQATASNSGSNAAANTPPACVDNSTESTLPAPEIYKPGGAVSAMQMTDLEKGNGAAAKAGDCIIV